MRLSAPYTIKTRTAIGMAANAGFWIQTFTATVQYRLRRAASILNRH